MQLLISLLVWMGRCWRRNCAATEKPHYLIYLLLSLSPTTDYQQILANHRAWEQTKSLSWPIRQKNSRLHAYHGLKTNHRPEHGNAISNHGGDLNMSESNHIWSHTSAYNTLQHWYKIWMLLQHPMEVNIRHCTTFLRQPRHS